MAEIPSTVAPLVARLSAAASSNRSMKIGADRMDGARSSRTSGSGWKCFRGAN